MFETKQLHQLQPSFALTKIDVVVIKLFWGLIYIWQSRHMDELPLHPLWCAWAVLHVLLHLFFYKSIEDIIPCSRSTLFLLLLSLTVLRADFKPKFKNRLCRGSARIFYQAITRLIQLQTSSIEAWKVTATCIWNVNGSFEPYCKSHCSMLPSRNLLAKNWSKISFFPSTPDATAMILSMTKRPRHKYVATIASRLLCRLSLFSCIASLLTYSLWTATPTPILQSTNRPDTMCF